MAKHKFRDHRSMHAKGFLLFAALVLGWGVLPGRAGQGSSATTPPNAKTAPGSGQRKAKSGPAKPAGGATQGRGTTSTPSVASLGAGKRDPFKLPPAGGEKGGPGTPIESTLNTAALPGGERGLLISQLVFEGFVRQQAENKMIAVVTNETKRAYFLHENQAVYNGVVSKITPDAVYFKENVLDANGQVTTREVVKRLGSAPGEER